MNTDEVRHLCPICNYTCYGWSLPFHLFTHHELQFIVVGNFKFRFRCVCGWPKRALKSPVRIVKHLMSQPDPLEHLMPAMVEAALRRMP